MEIVLYLEQMLDLIFGKINMKKNKTAKYHLVIAMFTILCFTTCTEEFVPKTETFEDLLVVQGNITDELKQHEIFISRTFRFEEEEASGESDAQVIVKDDLQNEYVFEETDPGKYVSTSAFQAVSDRTYVLSVLTASGKSYESDPVRLPQSVEIDNLYAERMTNENGQEGIGIFIDNTGPSGNASFYRYEFEEVYRFNAPLFNDEDIVILSEDPIIFDFVPRPQNKRTCYKRDASSGIVLTKTENLDENVVSKFMVRFVGTDSYIISDRYSILVHQFVQSRESHAYYENVETFSNSQTLFSQIQPGFINGNINAVNNPDENVIGLFEVTSVSSKRIFFNYRDFFPTENLPPYFEDCSVSSFNGPIGFLTALKTGLFLYGGEVPDEDGNLISGLVRKACGDCTEIGTNVRPQFWED